MGIGVIDIDNHECMTLGSIQTPNSKTLDSEEKLWLIGTAAILLNAKTNCKRFPTGCFVMHSSPKKPS